MLATSPQFSAGGQTQGGNPSDPLPISNRLETLGLMTAGLAHDLGNGVQVLTSAVNVLRAHPRIADVVELEPILTGASTSLDRVQAMVRSLLGFARAPTAGEEDVDPGICVREMQQLLGWAVADTVVLSMQVAVDLPKVRCNRQQLESALLNLILNANDAISGGGLIIVAVEGSERSVTFEVADSGSGMSAELQALAFDAFFTTKKTGTGLGLPMVRRFAEALGGCASIISAPDAGTRVRLTLPAVRSAQTERQRADELLDQALEDSFPASDPVSCSIG